MWGSSSGREESTIHDQVREEFERIGKRLFSEHLVGANFGNLSVRSGEGFLITRSGSYLDVSGDPVFVPLDGQVPDHASNEYRVHREIYAVTGYDAVVHAHPPYSIARSFHRDRIVPMDVEGTTFAPIIPVVEGKPGSSDLAGAVARAMKVANVVIARGHGTFAAGKNLDEAYLLTSLAEHSCRILTLAEGEKG